MKKIILFVLACLMVLSSCGSNEKKTTTKPKEATLKFSWWGGDARNNATLEAIKLYEAKNPGIKITPEYSDYNSYRQKLTTLIPSGNAADIIQLDNGWVELYGKENFVD